MARDSKKGLKFDVKYGVSAFQAYKCDPDTLVIPPKGHALYDPDGNTAFNPRRVAEIDKDGVFTGTVIVWTDKDANKLYVIEGRGNTLDVREVNRLRRERGDEEITIKVMPLDVDLDRAVEHVVLRNFHRKVPTVSHYAREVVRLARLGKTWGRIVEMLDVDGIDDAEQWCKKRVAVAHCVPEVAQAIDSGELSLAQARQFGGTAIDGSKALGKKAQLDLLEEMRAERDKPKSTVKALSAGARGRVFTALSNGATEKLKKDDRGLATFAAALISRLEGDEDALDDWPAIAEVVAEAAKKPEKGKGEEK